MHEKPLYIVDVIEDIVAKVSAELSDTLDFAVAYQHGHPLEIIENIKEQAEYTRTRSDTYPLIALFQDFDETTDRLTGEISAQLHIIIANLTDPKYKATDRYLKSFKPYLYNIYDELMYQISRSKYVSRIDGNWKKTDRLFWGRSGLYGNEGNIFNDHIDAIEITNLNLVFNNQTC